MQRLQLKFHVQAGGHWCGRHGSRSDWDSAECMVLSQLGLMASYLGPCAVAFDFETGDVEVRVGWVRVAGEGEVQPLKPLTFQWVKGSYAHKSIAVLLMTGGVGGGSAGRLSAKGAWGSAHCSWGLALEPVTCWGMQHEAAHRIVLVAGALELDLKFINVSKGDSISRPVISRQ